MKASDLSLEECEELLEFAEDFPHKWKSMLAKRWKHGTASGHLQVIRDRMGSLQSSCWLRDQFTTLPRLREVLQELEDKTMIKQQFPDVGGIYGAPMGRDTFGRTEDCEPETISIFKVRLDSGGYDDGGAYWGIPNNLYCASDNSDRYVQFVRAYSPREAALQLEIEPEYLAPEDYAEEARELLAVTLLEEEVISIMEDVSPEDFPDVSPDDLLERQNEIAQGDLSDYLQIENHLPWRETDKAIAEINLKWQGRYSVAQLYAGWGSKAIADLAIALLGGGCSPSDNPDIRALFVGLRIDANDLCQVYLEVWDAVIAIVKQSKASS